uniref:Uncharacterized protein n=1 Tax=Glossina brevipalpis TaxID=37001 RepID=A0A1A9WLZ4_9MUSC
MDHSPTETDINSWRLYNCWLDDEILFKVLLLLFARLAIPVPLCERLVVVVIVDLDVAIDVPDILSKSAVLERSIASPIFVMLVGSFGSLLTLRIFCSLFNIIAALVMLLFGTSFIDEDDNVLYKDSLNGYRSLLRCLNFLLTLIDDYEIHITDITDRDIHLTYVSIQHPLTLQVL